MRLISLVEKKKRGCESCMDKGLTFANGAMRSACPHEECPYHILDDYDTYEDYMASDDCKILVNSFFSAVPDGYELRKNSKRIRHIFSEGDSRVNL